MDAMDMFRHAMKLYAEQNKQDPDHRIASLIYQAAYLGCTDAQFFMPYLSLNYYCQNSETPEFWYGQAATQGGHPHAQYCYAISILNNMDRRDLQSAEKAKGKALYWLRKAAIRGITSAAFILHYVKILGLWGIDIDCAEADYWLQIARQNRAQFLEKQQSGLSNVGGIEPEDWEQEFHKESIFVLDENDLKKWNQNVINPK